MTLFGRLSARSRQRGFTLIEAIMSIVLIGILGGVVSVFMKSPIDGYIATVRRASLTDGADGAVRRIMRDVRLALPNSIRSINGGSNQCFEFLPVVGGGRYRVAQSSAATGDLLDFSASAGDSSFDVLANINLPSFSSATYHAVIYNLGIPGADAYDATNKNRAQIASASTAANIVLSAGNQFPFESPGKRLKVIPDYSVAYSCSGGKLLRSTQAISSALMASCPTTGTVLVGNVDCAASSFNYTQAATARSGLLAMTLVLTQQDESARLYDEAHVNNVP